MPKIVDHHARRAEIARALWRVVARDGLEGASVRVVAAEAGWSLGAVRHYFRTQDDLIGFATESMIEAVRHRVRSQLDEAAGMPRAFAMMAQLLPLDAERDAEVRVWLSLLGRASRNPGLTRLRLDAWRAERYLCRLVVSDLAPAAAPVPVDLLEPLGAPWEQFAAHLHTFIDGLTLQGATVPEIVGPADLRGQLQHHLDALADALLHRT